MSSAPCVTIALSSAKRISLTRFMVVRVSALNCDTLNRFALYRKQNKTEKVLFHTSN